MPRPHLTIEIEDPNDEQNTPSIPVPITNEVQQTHYERRPLRNDSSVKSIHSNTSNKSERQIILERSQKQLIESRLSRNIQSLNKLNLSLSKSRASSRRSKKMLEESIHRSKSTSEIGGNKSRVKMLKQIAEKLESLNEKNSTHQRNESYVDSRVSMNEGMYKDSNNRSNKLNSLLKQIKKCNQESNKPVYTIKKSKKQEALIIDSERKNQSKKTVDIESLSRELRDVRRELSDARRKNQELLNYTKEKEEMNSGSRISRVSNLDHANHHRTDSSSKYPSIDRTSGYKKYLINGTCPTCGCTCKGRSQI